MLSPQPLPPKSQPPQVRHHVTIKNRRLHYLHRHTPSYFHRSGLAEANPLLHDRLIRQFQTVEERQTEGETQGWAGRMYEDLMRAERRLEMESVKRAEESRRQDQGESAVEEVEEEGVESREEGERQWQYLMTLRFLEGLDTDFNYDDVDFDEQWDDLAQLARDREDEYFDDEEPTWYEADGNGHSMHEQSSGHVLKGQTGIQDF
ncbi:coiled-coil domain-containing protein-domain-containing protein [Lipomyces chichibuensis]|uniref:coiled-coil domain-containing protein-domain-containing protein n=1 Tax=Lipomyces chichibuensis TaxID=1546026 RepID=UPI0033435D0C